MKGVGMTVISLKVVKFRFWSQGVLRPCEGESLHVYVPRLNFKPFHITIWKVHMSLSEFHPRPLINIRNV